MGAVVTKNDDLLEIKIEGRWSEIAETKEKVKSIPGRRWNGDKKVWTVPADPVVADRLLKMIRPEADEAVMEWLRASMTNHEESLTTPLPGDAKLLIPWADRRCPWQPEIVNDERFEGALPWQRAAIDAMASWKRALLCDDMGLGKAESIFSLVLTPTGWTTMGELKVGDFVVGSDGHPTMVEAVYPQGVKPLYRVTMKDGASVLAADDHLWSVRTPNDRFRNTQKWRTKTTLELLQTHDAAGNRRWEVPLVSPVRFVEQTDPLPIAPYFLGVLLGDGCLRKSVTLTCHFKDKTIVDRCQVLTDDTLRPRADRLTYGVCGGNTKSALVDLGLMERKSSNKFIPEVYLRASVDDRLALLQGLMDTDGYNHPLGRAGSPGCSAEIAVSCERLADGIQELVRSLGGTARRRIKKTTHLDSHRITVKLPPEFNPFQHPRKAERYGARTKYPLIQPIQSVEYECDGEAVCIRVAAEDHLYVTEDYIVTHNTFEAMSAVEEWRLRNKLADNVTIPTGPKLVIAPASVLGGWNRELKRWLPDGDVRMIDASDPRKRHDQLAAAINDDAWAVANWEQLRVKRIEAKKARGSGKIKMSVMKEPLFQYPQAAQWDTAHEDWDIPLWRKAEREFGGTPEPWLAVIADEIHRAKNKDAAQTKGLHRVYGQVMYGLTGTPIMNSPDELWSLLAWLWPDEYHERGAAYAPGAVPYWTFYETHVDYWEDHHKRKVITGVKNPDALRYALKGKLIRRTAKILGLKGRKRFYYDVPMTKKQQKLYDEAEKAMWLAVEQDVAAGNKEAIAFARLAAEGGTTVELMRIPNGAARFVRLQQIIENAALLGGPDESANMDDFEAKFEESGQAQWVVFCNYKESCDILASRLRNKYGDDIRVEIYNGDVRPQDRTEIEDAYQRGEVHVIIGTIAAMYQGITLTNGHLQHWLSRAVVPAWNEQGEARQDRLGQQELVRVYIPQAPDTVATDKVHVINRLKEGIVKAIIPQDEIQQEG